MRKFLLAFISFLPVWFAGAQSLLGTWNGNLQLGQTSLPLVVHLSEQGGENKCLLDSPDQGAKGIVAILDFLSSDSLAFSVPALRASYRGSIQAGVLKGTFSQSGMKLQLDLKRGDYVRVRKQTPQPPLSYPTEEVTFENKEDHAVLSGTLSYPVTYLLKKKVPVVLLVTGSGHQNRDEEILGHRPFAVLADYLAKMGIASLRYDDRGFGQSTGDISSATSQTFMKDALAGVDYLQSTGKFGKIGILGHSEGGMIAFMAVNERPADVDFIVSLAGTALRGDQILLKQNENLLSAHPQTAPICTAYCQVLDKIFQHLIADRPVTDVQNVVQQYQKAVGSDLPPGALQNLEAVLRTGTPWFKYFLSYDPLPVISKVTCPVMAINGELDKQVDAQTNLDAIRKHLPENSQHQIKSYGGLNHLFQSCTTGAVEEYGRIEETISPKVLSDIAQWILQFK